MPDIGIYLIIFGVMVSYSSKSSDALWLSLLAIWIIYNAFRAFLKSVPFVSKQKYAQLQKEYKDLSARNTELMTVLSQSEARIKKIIDEYGDDFERTLVIKGQNAVFQAYVEDRSKFQYYLNDYLAVQARNKQQEEAQRERRQRFHENANRSYRAYVKPQSNQDWRKILGVEKSDDYDTVKSVYHGLVKKYHPDKGGDEQKMKDINVAWGEAERFFGK